MDCFRSYSAFFLLMLFLRVMAPENALLSLHGHIHTEDELTKELHVDKPHKHCHAHDLYNGSFESCTFHFEPSIIVAHSSSYAARYSFVWKYTFPNNTYLRGPPVA